LKDGCAQLLLQLHLLAEQAFDYLLLFSEGLESEICTGTVHSSNVNTRADTLLPSDTFGSL
jgi:hypothetical protein